MAMAAGFSSVTSLLACREGLPHKHADSLCIEPCVLFLWQEHMQMMPTLRSTRMFDCS